MMKYILSFLLLSVDGFTSDVAVYDVCANPVGICRNEG